MSAVLVVFAIFSAFVLARIRVQNADEIYKKAVLMNEFSDLLEKNYLQDIESVYTFCAKFFQCQISDGDAEYLDAIIREKLNPKDEDFLSAVFSLSSACGTEIEGIIKNIKEIAKISKDKALSELNAIKSCAYVFYPGVVFILALLTL